MGIESVISHFFNVLTAMYPLFQHLLIVGFERRVSISHTIKIFPISEKFLTIPTNSFALTDIYSIFFKK